MRTVGLTLTAVAAGLAAAGCADAGASDPRAGQKAAAQKPARHGQRPVPRTPDGHPDLQGNWTNATITMLERRGRTRRS